MQEYRPSFSSGSFRRALFLLPLGITTIRAWQTESLLNECPTDTPLVDWDIGNPEVIARRQGLNLNYQMPNCVVYDVTYEVFEPDCINQIDTVPLVDNDGGAGGQVNDAAPLLSQLIWLDEYQEQGQVQLRINPNSIANFPTIYSERSRSGDEIKGVLSVCVRLWLWNSQGYQVTFVDDSVSTSVEFSPNRRKTKTRRRHLLEATTEKPLPLMLLRRERPTLQQQLKHSRRKDEAAMLAGGNYPIAETMISTQIQNVSNTRMLQGGTACKETWGVDVFVCPDQGDENQPPLRSDYPITTADEPLEQGKFLYLCIQLNDEAVDDGAALHKVSELTYLQGGAANVQQAISNDGELAGDGLTSILCDTKTGTSSAQQVCRIRSMFYISFFGIEGQQKQNADGSLSTIPVDLVGSVAITSSGFGRRNPLIVDFQLDFLLQPVAVESSSAATISTNRAWPTKIFAFLLMSTMPLLLQ